MNIKKLCSENVFPLLYKFNQRKNIASDYIVTIFVFKWY